MRKKKPRLLPCHSHTSPPLTRLPVTHPLPPLSLAGQVLRNAPNVAIDIINWRPRGYFLKLMASRPTPQFHVAVITLRIAAEMQLISSPASLSEKSIPTTSAPGVIFGLMIYPSHAASRLSLLNCRDYLTAAYCNLRRTYAKVKFPPMNPLKQFPLSIDIPAVIYALTGYSPSFPHGRGNVG